MAHDQHVFSSFDWDENKRLINIEKHGIDFLTAADLLTHPHFENRSDRNGEQRVIAICPAPSRLVAIIYLMRGDICRIISARAASKNEQRAYREVYDRGDSPEDR